MEIEDKKKILIIEDDEIMLNALKRILEKSKEFNIDTAKNGKEGIEKIDNEKYNLIISDVFMPYFNGMEILSYIKAKYSIPVIIISSISDENIIIEALGNGASDYLKKPVMAGELLMKIKKFIKL